MVFGDKHKSLEGRQLLIASFPGFPQNTLEGNDYFLYHYMQLSTFFGEGEMYVCFLCDDGCSLRANGIGVVTSGVLFISFLKCIYTKDLDHLDSYHLFALRILLIFPL